MKATLMRAYGLTCYGISMLTIFYAALFFGNIYVPRTIDIFSATPTATAASVNVALVVAFALQHSGMARPGFKQVLARIVGPCLVRSTYVLVSSVAVVTLMVCWQPIGSLVWLVEATLPRLALVVLYFSGWILIVWSTCLIDHLELFGLRQVMRGCRGESCPEPGFQTPGAYRHVRHPTQLGWLIVLWATPVMTVTHLLLAVGMTIYIVIGTHLEERTLRARFASYRQYERKVPMFLPSLRRRLDL